MKFDTLSPIIIILFVKHVDCKKMCYVQNRNIHWNNQTSPKIYFRPQACTSILAGAPVGIRRWAVTVNLLQPWGGGGGGAQLQMLPTKFWKPQTHLYSPEVFKFERKASSNVVGIIFPPVWKRVDWAPKFWGAEAPLDPPSPPWTPLVATPLHRVSIIYAPTYLTWLR